MSGELRFTGHALNYCVYTISSREPVFTSLEDAPVRAQFAQWSIQIFSPMVQEMRGWLAAA